MAFQSILFAKSKDSIRENSVESPAFWFDLNLDQIVEAVTAGKNEYNLKPFFYAALDDIDSIRYRQEIFQDLENAQLLENIRAFSQKMRTMRDHLAQAEKLYYRREKQSWFLHAVAIYCDAVTNLNKDLTLEGPKSRGFRALRKYVDSYITSEGFTQLQRETENLLTDLSSIEYCLLIAGNRIQVRKYKCEADYSADVEKTFEKFKQGQVKDYRIKFSGSPGMNHVEAAVIDFVAQLYPNVFSHLDGYYAEHVGFPDQIITVFDREIQFYIAYLELVAKLTRQGLKFCYPLISSGSKEVYNYDGFDLALANLLSSQGTSVVCNDFYLKDKERIFVVTGPNQGGKTTFARTFGQLHHLARIGCPVPGREAQLFPCDRLFTHFEREESINNLRGKLQDDLVRIHDILNLATPNSIIIMNEIFTSTTLQDAVFLSKRVMEKVSALDVLCVWVTFIDELSSFSEQTVSMVSTVVPQNPALRTYKIVRKPADGLSYAISIAEKHRLTYEHLKERIQL